MLPVHWPPTASARVMSSLRMASTAPNSAQRASYSASRSVVMACFRGDCCTSSSPPSATSWFCKTWQDDASPGWPGACCRPPVGACERVPPRARVCCALFYARVLKSSSVTCQSCFWATLSECPRKADATCPSRESPECRRTLVDTLGEGITTPQRPLKGVANTPFGVG